MINYLDRSNVTNARVAGMQEDMNMTDVQWSAGISLFYAGYMATQLPGTLLLSKFKPRIMIPVMMYVHFTDILETLLMLGLDGPFLRFVSPLSRAPPVSPLLDSLLVSLKVPSFPRSPS